MKNFIISMYTLIGVVLCQSCSAEPQTSYELAVQQAEKFKMPVVVSHQAIEEYNKSEIMWSLSEFDGIKIGYSESQDINKIKNLLEENVFLFEQHSYPYRKTDLVDITGIEIGMPLFFKMISECGIQVMNFKDYNYKITTTGNEITLEQSCKIMISILAINEIKMERIKDNNFRLTVYED